MLKLQAARLATAAAAGQHEYPLVVELAVLLRLETVLLTAAQEVTEAPGHLRRPHPGARLGTIGDHVLDLGIRPLRPREVPAFPVRVDRAHQLHVRRRHRRSVPGPTARFDALPALGVVES